MYGDNITNSMEKAISETNRRRKIQMEYNEKHNITPKTVMKDIREIIEISTVAEETVEYNAEDKHRGMDLPAYINKLEEEMKQAAKDLQFERAAQLRDEIIKFKKEIES